MSFWQRIVWLLLLVVLGSVAVAITQRSMAKKLRKRGQFECAIRSPALADSSAKSKWRHGVASIEPGTLRFRPGGPGGLRRPRGEAIVIPVEQVPAEGAASLRRTTWKEAWSIRPGLMIITVKGQGSTTEIAAPPSGIALIRAI